MDGRGLQYTQHSARSLTYDCPAGVVGAAGGAAAQCRSRRLWAPLGEAAAPQQDGSSSSNRPKPGMAVGPTRGEAWPGLLASAQPAGWRWHRRAAGRGRGGGAGGRWWRQGTSIRWVADGGAPSVTDRWVADQVQATIAAGTHLAELATSKVVPTSPLPPPMPSSTFENLQQT